MSVNTVSTIVNKAINTVSSIFEKAKIKQYNNFYLAVLILKGVWLSGTDEEIKMFIKKVNSRFKNGIYKMFFKFTDTKGIYHEIEVTIDELNNENFWVSSDYGNYKYFNVFKTKDAIRQYVAKNKKVGSK